MPLYTYHCVKCGEQEDVIMRLNDRDKPRLHSCGCPMARIISIPQPAIIKKTGRGMALDSLNSKETNHMKPEMKAEAAKGLERLPKTIF